MPPATPNAAPTAPSPAAPSRSSGPAILAAVAGFVVLALIVVGVIWQRSSVGDTAVVSATTTPVVTATATVVVSPRAAPTVAPTAAAASKTVRSLPSGSWLTVLNSLPQAEVAESAAQAEATTLSSGSATVVVVDSSAIPGLKPGYWAVSMVGFSSREQARDACSRVGRSPGATCYDRQVK